VTLYEAAIKKIHACNGVLRPANSIEEAALEGWRSWRQKAFRYKTTPDVLALIEYRQGHVCAGCEDRKEGRKLSVDHDHRTKRVRGMLCVNCNTLLGLAKDRPTILRRLARYLVKSGKPKDF